MKSSTMLTWWLIPWQTADLRHNYIDIPILSPIKPSHLMTYIPDYGRDIENNIPRSSRAGFVKFLESIITQCSILPCVLLLMPLLWPIFCMINYSSAKISCFKEILPYWQIYFRLACVTVLHHELANTMGIPLCFTSHALCHLHGIENYTECCGQCYHIYEAFRCVWWRRRGFIDFLISHGNSFGAAYRAADNNITHWPLFINDYPFKCESEEAKSPYTQGNKTCGMCVQVQKTFILSQNIP